MDDEIYEKYILAGEIAAKAREYGVKNAKPGGSILELVNDIESMILDEGVGIAFPVNISINEVAAHFSPHHTDKSLFFRTGDVVKIDVGAHVDGFIADTASTVEIKSNKYEDIIKASRVALDQAITLLKPDVKLSEVGKTIQDVIASFGFRSIDNLTGHSLARYNLHSGFSVPNIADKSNVRTVKAGDVFAIEPFATNGAGHVVSGGSSNIYRSIRSVRSKLVRNSNIRILSKKIHNEFNNLPFAERWCIKLFSNPDMILKKLLFAGCIQQYPQLIDRGRGIVTQAEHTVIVTEDGCEVTT